jgi:hypothetical protein
MGSIPYVYANGTYRVLTLIIRVDQNVSTSNQPYIFLINATICGGNILCFNISKPIGVALASLYLSFIILDLDNYANSANQTIIWG